MSNPQNRCTRMQNLEASLNVLCELMLDFHLLKNHSFCLKENVPVSRPKCGRCTIMYRMLHRPNVHYFNSSVKCRRRGKLSPNVGRGIIVVSVPFVTSHVCAELYFNKYSRGITGGCFVEVKGL